MLSIIAPLKSEPSTCGYCGPPGERSQQKTSYHAASLMGVRLACDTYQKMIDRGWRRSGEHCYQPDLKRSCCPQYTIKSHALQFKPSKSQRKLVNRFNRWILYGDDHEDAKAKNAPKAASKEDAFVLETSIHQAEYNFCSHDNFEPAHKFEVTLEPSSYTEEKFALFQLYQQEIHKEKEKKPQGFKRFLVETPLMAEPIPYGSTPPSHLPEDYGSYHQMYRIDGELVAMGVIDILPNCVSSVYFMYDNKWERFSLGKLSALRELSLAKEIHAAGARDMQYLYMGFYIYTCAKMKYKGDYSPSYLADPEEYTWHPLEECKKALEKHRYACFAHPENSISGPYIGPEPTYELSPSLLNLSKALHNVRSGGRYEVMPLTATTSWATPGPRRSLMAVLQGLGEEIMQNTIFYIMYVL